MEDRFVTWGTEGGDKKVLIALQLQKQLYKVSVFLFDTTIANKEFADKMMQEWSKGKELAFPEGFRQLDRPLSEDSLLPDDIRVENTGRIRQLQNEWAYLLLTEKLVESIVDEIRDLKEKAIDSLQYSKEYFDSAKTLWERILEHGKEKNISREKIDELKAEINIIFDRLKDLRNTETKKYSEQAENIYHELKDQIANTKKLIEEMKPAKELLDGMKELRSNVNKLTLRKPQREELHKFLDECFDLLHNRKNVREHARNDKRIKDLTEIIDKMEKSLQYDKKELDFQLKRMNDKNVNQLESQLRNAKIKMLEEKVSSKEEKLADVKRTLEEIQGK